MLAARHHKGGLCKGVGFDLAMSVKDRIESMRPIMEPILSEYRHGKNPPVVTPRDKAITLCRSQNMLRKQHTHVGVQPRNRHGDGLAPEHVYKLVDAFSAHGFSLNEIGVPLALEVPPATHPPGAEVRAFNEAIVKDAQGALPPIAEEEYLCMSLARSHSSMASRSVIFEMPHDNEMITDGDNEEESASVHQDEATDADHEKWACSVG